MLRISNVKQATKSLSKKKKMTRDKQKFFFLPFPMQQFLFILTKVQFISFMKQKTNPI